MSVTGINGKKFVLSLAWEYGELDCQFESGMTGLPIV